jgi:hypothetical protein
MEFFSALTTRECDIDVCLQCCGKCEVFITLTKDFISALKSPFRERIFMSGKVFIDTSPKI